MVDIRPLKHVLDGRSVFLARPAFVETFPQQQP